MAARITENDQIQFLLSCVRHSNHGQVDFDPVVEECQLISKGAAATRLSRLLKRYPAGAKPSTASSNTNSKTPKPATGESNDEEGEKDTPGQKSGRSGKGSGGGSPAKKSSAGPVVGGVVKKTANTASKGRKGKAAAIAAPVAAADAPGFGEDGLLDGINVKTEESYEDGMYNAGLDPAGLFGSDA